MNIKEKKKKTRQNGELNARQEYVVIEATSAQQVKKQVMLHLSSKNDQ